MTEGKYEKCADGRITWIYLSVVLESKEDNVSVEPSLERRESQVRRWRKWQWESDRWLSILERQLEPTTNHLAQRLEKGVGAFIRGTGRD